MCRWIGRSAAFRSAAASVALLSTVLAGCAQIPNSGPIDQGEQVRASIDDPLIRVLPRPPEPGLTQEQIVAGFLSASASFEGDHAVARQFLTARASENWNSAAGVVVYDDNPGLSLTTLGRRVTVKAKELSYVSPDGSLEPRPGRTVHEHFRLVHVGNEWRINRLTDGLFLTQFDVARSYRSYALHFLAPGVDRLVPDPVFIPLGRTGAATSLVRSLLDGPTRWLAPAVGTAFPAGSHLVVDAVPVENGVAQVDLSDDVLAASNADRERLAAQLVWTLTELPDITGVRITVEGSALALPGVPEIQTEDTWERFDPNALPSATTGLIVRHGRVRQLVVDGSVPLVGPLGDGRYLASHPALSPDGSVVAALSRDSRSVVLEEPLVSRGLQHVLSGPRFVAPSIDDRGSLWLAGRSRGSTMLWVVPRGGKPEQVAAPQLRRRTVLAFRVALDGARAVVIVQTHDGQGRLLIGRLVTVAGQPTLQALRPLEDRLADVRDVSWMAADAVVALGHDQGSVLQPFAISIDGSIDPVGGTTLQGIASIAAAPGLPLLAATDGAGIWQNSGVGWRTFIRGRDPAYPG